MILQPGMRSVVCNHCGVAGQLRIRRSARTKKAVVEDHIEHLERCKLFKRPQPAHLKNRKSWQAQEKRANALVGARSTLASGAVNEDGDGRLLGEWRVESKQTKHPDYVLSQAVWSKLVMGALMAGEEPMLHVEAAGETRVAVREDWFLGRGGDPARLATPTTRRRATALIGASSPPFCHVALAPRGVVLLVDDFLRLKEGP